MTTNCVVREDLIRCDGAVVKKKPGGGGRKTHRVRPLQTYPPRLAHDSCRDGIYD